jgi:hypothetical protein
MGDKKETKLRVKGLLIDVGSVEDSSLSTLIVGWEGKPFADAQEAVRHFYRACLAECVQKVIERKECCELQLAVRADSKACPNCGGKIDKPKKKNFGDYIRDLHRADVDSFDTAAYPLNAPEYDARWPNYLGGWVFGAMMPENCHMVEVPEFDSYDEEPESFYCRVIKIGKRV